MTHASQTIDKTKGFSILEIIISVAIISFVTVTATTFQRDVFSLNTTIQSSLIAQLDARHLVKVMVGELRETSPSSVGSYPVVLASSTGMTFYADIDNDGLKDRVRYYLSGATIKKAVLAPNGNPLVYNTANEKISTLIDGVVASSTLPIFQYYPSSYTGTTTPLVQPVDVSLVRLVKITVIIDKDPNRSPSKIIVTSQVTLRNLKDNL